MSADRSGKTLENAVARIQHLMEPGAVVKKRERISNRHGVPREFDVTVRGNFAGHAMLGVIECKDWAGKVGTPEMDAFITKSSDVNANFRLIVSSKGFTAPALAQAKDAGVGVFSLPPEPGTDAEFSLGILWYGLSYFWDDRQAEIRFAGPFPEVGSYGEKDVCYQGKPVVNWFSNELSTTYRQSKMTGKMVLARKFEVPLEITVREQPYLISEVVFSAVRTVRKKSRFMQITGDAMLNWETKKVSIPPKATISVHQFNPCLTDWDDYDGEIPETCPYQFTIEHFWVYNEGMASDIPDLGQAKPFQE
jgi:hypothetical protein